MAPLKVSLTAWLYFFATLALIASVALADHIHDASEPMEPIPGLPGPNILLIPMESPQASAPPPPTPTQPMQQQVAVATMSKAASSSVASDSPFGTKVEFQGQAAQATVVRIESEPQPGAKNASEDEYEYYDDVGGDGNELAAMQAVTLVTTTTSTTTTTVAPNTGHGGKRRRRKKRPILPSSMTTTTPISPVPLQPFGAPEPTFMAPGMPIPAQDPMAAPPVQQALPMRPLSMKFRISARDLSHRDPFNGKSDPFVRVYSRRGPMDSGMDSLVGQTEKVDNMEDVSWITMVSFNSYVPGTDQFLLFKVYDQDPFSFDEFLGQALIQADALYGQQRIMAQLTNEQGTRGYGDRISGDINVVLLGVN